MGGGGGDGGRWVGRGFGRQALQGFRPPPQAQAQACVCAAGCVLLDACVSAVSCAGARVMCQWRQSRAKFAGHIIRVNEDELDYDVQYDDGA